jgi:hypothetical protein
LNLKKLSSIVLFLFFGTLASNSQSRYAVEFIGGMKYSGMGPSLTVERLNGFTAGLGVSMYLGTSAELIGTTLFTYYPPSNIRDGGYRPMYYYDALGAEGQYGGEISAGLRFHGKGSQFVHPYLVFQGGMLLLRSTVFRYASVMPDVSSPEFLNIQGTEDIQMFGTINVGFGVQTRLMESVLLNLEAKYQILVGSNSSLSTNIPVVMSVQLPV